MDQNQEFMLYVTDQLMKSMDAGLINVQYQQIRRTITGALCGMELTAKWVSDKYGIIHYKALTTVLEQQQMIHILHLHILRQACEKMRMGREQGLDILPVSLKLSRVDFLACDIFLEIEEIVKEYNIPRHMIRIEIAHFSAEEYGEQIHIELDKFGKAGYEIWLDSLGTNKVSLYTIQKNDFHGIKIDIGVFTTRDEKSKTILRSLVSMAKKMGMQTIAEDVVDDSQVEFLFDIGCEMIEGQIYGEATEKENLIQYAKDNKILIENEDERKYYDVLGKVDFVTDKPLAVTEFDGDQFKYLYTNNAIHDVWRTLGAWDLSIVYHNLNSDDSPIRRGLIEFQKSLVVGDDFKPYYYTIRGQSVRLMGKSLYEGNGKVLGLAEITNISMEREIEISSGLGTQDLSQVSVDDVNTMAEAMRRSMYEPNPIAAIDSLLAFYGKSIDCDRMYIYEKKDDVFINTFEWCEEGISSLQSALLEVEVDTFEVWLNEFDDGRSVIIENIESMKDIDTVAYNYLKKRGVNSTIASALYSDGNLVGFFGFDNPPIANTKPIFTILRSLSNFIESLIMRRELFDQMRHENELKAELNAANAASAAKSRFLSNMSHDIRTPMNAILGYANIAKSRQDDPQSVLDCVDEILIAGDHLLGLINDILEMSRVESGKENLYLEDYSFSKLEKQIMAIIAPQISDKGVELIFNFDEVVHQNFVVDIQKLRRIIINIMGNSVKFTDKGSISLIVSESEELGTNYSVYTFRIKDTGSGMSKQFKDHVFEAFTRERTSTDSNLKGTGLGMAITKNYVDMMEGMINVESEPGVGTEFVVSLRLQTKEGSDIGDASIDENDKDKKDVELELLEGKKILLVEDNPTNSTIAKIILEQAGLVVEPVFDGQQAVDRLKEKWDYDCILMDLQMPVMDGICSTRIIRSMENEYLHQVPIIALTANAFMEDITRCIDAGMNDHVAKPFEKDILLEKISRYIKRDMELSPDKNLEQ